LQHTHTHKHTHTHTHRMKILHLTGFYPVIHVLSLIISFGKVEAYPERLRGKISSFDEPCLAVIEDYESFDRKNDTYALSCLTRSGLLYDVKGLGVTVDWIKKNLASGELKSAATELQFPKGAKFTGQDQIETDWSPDLINIEGRRKLVKTSGTRTVLVVRAVGGGSIRNAYTQAQYSNSVFGNNVNLKTQMSACSHDKLNFIATKYSDKRITNGVTTVTVKEDPSKVGVKAFERAVVKKLQSMFRVTGDKIADHAYLNYWLSA
jgi:hypothetical protein